jgi:hypothetical protein
MATLNDLAELLFPDVTKTIADLEKEYPARHLPEGAEVTRFAPSPTGFLHTGSLFTSLIGWTIAKQSHGVFYFRLEDTDTKRTIEGSGDELIAQLKFSASWPMKAISPMAIKASMALISNRTQRHLPHRDQRVDPSGQSLSGFLHDRRS